MASPQYMAAAKLKTQKEIYIQNQGQNIYLDYF